MKPSDRLQQPSTFVLNRVNGWDLVENFFICAVTSIIAIRVFLYFTHYPQLGSSRGLHIAHMLWGGLLMSIALFQTLMFLNKQAKQWASVIGGIGFGMFIDELGKFITQDNNYFYQPTIAIMYGIFVAFVLGARIIFRQTQSSQEDYVTNALEVMKETPLHQLDIIEREKAIGFLERSDPNDALVKTLTESLNVISPQKGIRSNFLQKVKATVRSTYSAVMKKKKLTGLFFALFIFVSVADLLAPTVYILADPFTLRIDFNIPASGSDIGIYVTSALSGLFVLIGLGFLLIQKSRLKLYEMCQHALLISIFLTQFFLFYQEQLMAVFTLTINILLYATVRYLISQELLLEKIQHREQ